MSASRMRIRVSLSLLTLILGLLVPVSSRAQFIPYYGKNKVHYDAFSWRVYKSPHFEIYYYPELEQHLGRVASYAESAYQKVSSALKHTLSSPVPLVLYKTHSEFEQTSLFPSFVPEGVAAFAEPGRSRMVLPIDEPPDRLYGLIAHELTHVFEFDLIPRGMMQREIPLWVDEGLADYMRETWDSLDLMMVRDAAVIEQVPRLSRLDEEGSFGSPRFVYNFGHAAFEFIEARFGKEGVRQFLYALRKGAMSTESGPVFKRAFRLEAEEVDSAFAKWLKERFKPYRDKERPTDYGKSLSPDSERTAYTQVLAFSPSPSGELIAALSGNRSDGELDLVLLSGRDGSVVKNLTKGYTDRFEDISLNDSFIAGRSLSFDPLGDFVAFFGRTGKGRSLFLVSVVSGKIVRRVSIGLDLPQAPCLLPGAKGVLFSALKDGVSDIYLLDLTNGKTSNLTQDEFRDSDPQLSPDGKMVVYTRRVSGHENLCALYLDHPAQKTQLTLGTHDDLGPSFSSDGNLIYYASDEQDGIFNIRSLDLRTGVVRQYTDVLGANTAPAVLHAPDGERLAFISYHKAEYRLHSIDLKGTRKEVEQEQRVAQVEQVDFQPDVAHTVLPENKRRLKIFEKFYLEGRPPIDVGVTSGGDFFGGSQLAFSDVLGDRNLSLAAFSEREFRTYQGTYFDLSHRLIWGLTAFDSTIWGFADPYGYVNVGFSREGALTSRRVSGGALIAQYPLDRRQRLELSVGVVSERDNILNDEARAFLEAQAALLGGSLYLNNGTVVPLSVAYVRETTRFQSYGPLSGSTLYLGLEGAPRVGNTLSRFTWNFDARRYHRLLPGFIFAARVRAFRSVGDTPDYFFFGGNMELRGFDYRSFSGNEGFFSNVELRFPVIDVMKTPIGLLGPVRGTLFAGIGGARWKGQPFQLGAKRPGLSYVNDAYFGEPVEGYHLIDGRASYGIGLQFFFLGYPLHFDWSKYTDLQISSKKTYFSFWVGFDF